MKKSLPWVVAVILGYIGVIVAVIYVLPAPWKWAAVAVIALMATRFAFTIKAASRIGMRNRSQPK